MPTIPGNGRIVNSGKLGTDFGDQTIAEVFSSLRESTVWAYDDFVRADTAPGVLGTPDRGNTWDVRGTVAEPGNTIGAIVDKRVVLPFSGARQVLYFTQELAFPIRRIGAEISWTAGNGGSGHQYDTFAMLIGPNNEGTELTRNSLHFTVTRYNCHIELIINGAQPFVELAGFTHPSGMLANDGTIYLMEMQVVGDTIYYNFNNVKGSVTDSRISDLTGNNGTWEIFRENSSGLTTDFLRIERVWVGDATFIKKRRADSDDLEAAVVDALSAEQITPAKSISAGTLPDLIGDLQGKTLAVYDDFFRANTTDGVAGSPIIGSAWDLRGSGATSTATKGKIISNRLVMPAADGTDLYAVQHLGFIPTQWGACISWEAGNAGASYSTMVLLMGPNGSGGTLVTNCIRVAVTRVNFAINKIVSSSSTSLVSTSFSGTHDMTGTKVFCNLRLVGTTLWYSFRNATGTIGASGSVTDASFATICGPWLTWRLQNGSTSSYIDQLRLEEAWVGPRFPAKV